MELGYEALIKAGAKDSHESMLAYRTDLYQRCKNDIAMQSAAMACCREDVLFFYNAFLWVFEPRARIRQRPGKKPLPQSLPFNTWPHQDAALRAMASDECGLGIMDVGVIKSRGEGASWMAVMKALYDIIFKKDQEIGMASSSLPKTDTYGDRSSLFGKIDWSLTMLPAWMVGDARMLNETDETDDWIRNKSKHLLKYKPNNSIIVGVASTKRTGRGGRYTWFFLDELAEWDFQEAHQMIESLQQSVESRLVVSTPDGPLGAYAEFVHEASTQRTDIKLMWWENPTRNRGLYRMTGRSTCEAVNPDTNPLLSHYDPPSDKVKELWDRLRSKEFAMDGLRSEWYDIECDRPRATPEGIAKELDGSFGRSIARIFPEEFFVIADKAVQVAETRGRLVVNPEDPKKHEFLIEKDGPCHLWFKPGPDRKPPYHSYAAGIDISSGKGGIYTANSVISVIDRITNEQVFEFATNRMEPSEFADFCMGVCYWFHTAFMCWEVNFEGGFAGRVLEKQYPDLFSRRLDWERKRSKTRKIGWHTSDKSKEKMFDDMSVKVRTGFFIPRSRLLVEECGQYIRDVRHKIKHVAEDKSTNNHEGGKQHGDRVIAFSLAIQACLERPLPSVKRVESKTAEWIVDNPPLGTMARRFKEHQESLLTRDGDWDDRSLGDIAHRP